MISQTQEEVYDFPRLLPTDDSGLDYIPRVVIQNVIISKRIWRISTRDLLIIKGSMIKFNEYLHLMRLINTKKIPRFVNAFAESDANKRAFDLFNPFSLIMLKRYREEKFVYVEEMLPSPQSVDLLDQQIGHLSQCCINNL